MTMDSEQPKSLVEIIRQDNDERFDGMVNSGIVIALGSIASRYRMSGRPVIADRAEELAGRIESKMIADQIRKFIPESNIVNQDSEIIEAGIVDTDQNPDQLTDRI